MDGGIANLGRDFSALGGEFSADLPEHLARKRAHITITRADKNTTDELFVRIVCLPRCKRGFTPRSGNASPEFIYVCTFLKYQKAGAAE